MARTPYVDKNGLKKGTWTAEEDMRLAAYVAAYGCRNWRRLPKYAGLARCGKSCRLRWLNYLRPDIKRGNFTKEEKAAIVDLHQSLGNKWSIIATHLPGRTDNEIKNYWNTHMTKKSKPKPTAPDESSAAQPVASSSSSSDDVVSQPQVEIIRTSMDQSDDSDNTRTYETNVEVVVSSSPQDEEYYLSLPEMSAESRLAQSPTTASPNAANRGCSVSVMNDFGGDFWSQPFVVDADHDYAQGEMYSSTTTDDDGYFVGQLHEEDVAYMLWLHYNLHNELL